MLDYPASPDTRLKTLEHEVQLLKMQLSQHFNRREPALGMYRQVRLARTVVDSEATPTYPVPNDSSAYYSIDTANTFPIVFLDGGFPSSAGIKQGAFEERSDVPQAHVHNLSLDWIPVDTELEVFQLRGSDTDNPGEWWCERPPPLHIGKTQEAIDQNAVGTVRRYNPHYTSMVSTGVDFEVVNKFADVAADRWCAFQATNGVYYMIAAECTPGYVY